LWEFHSHCMKWQQNPLARHNARNIGAINLHAFANKLKIGIFEE
jgi:hypothetical protein